jgi:hypothetical protein
MRFIKNMRVAHIFARWFAYYIISSCYKIGIMHGRWGIKKPLIRQAGSAGALIGSAAAGRELDIKLSY